MASIKETSELLRAVSAVLVEYLDAVKDGNFGVLDKLKFIGLYPTISAGIRGVSEIGSELQDLDAAEQGVLIAEIRDMLLRSGKFTHREADLAQRVLELAYTNVVEIAAMLALPPSAEAVP